MRLCGRRRAAEPAPARRGSRPQGGSAEGRGIAVPEAADFDSVTGGVSGTVEGKTVRVGSAQFLRTQGVADAGSLSDRADEPRADGKTVFSVAIGDRVAGLVAAADPVKASMPPAVEALHRMGLRLSELTGDEERTAKAVAAADATLLRGDLGDLGGIVRTVTLGRAVMLNTRQTLWLAFVYNVLGGRWRPVFPTPRSAGCSAR